MEYTIPDLLQTLALVHGDTPALASGDRQISYAELPATAQEFAAALAALGLHPGDRVGMALRDGLDFMQALCAIWTLGAIPVPIDFRASAAERTNFAAEFDLATILEDRRLVGATYSATHWHDTVVPIAKGRKGPADARTAPAATALISLTSGTTGKPLGVLLDHAALINRALGYSLEGPYPSRARFLNVYPLSFSASRNHTIGHLLRGGTIIFRPSLFDASDLVDWTLTDRATFLFAVGASVKGMLDVAPETTGILFPDLKMLYSGGSGMATGDKLDAARRLTPGFLHCFSATLSGTCSVLTGADLIARPDTDGRIVPQARVEIVDESGQSLPFGTTGILRVRTPGMARGFHADRDRPEGDRIRNGWAFTGDLAQVSSDGFLTVVGRTSDMIIRGGANVYPAEVEAVLTAIPGVREAAVVGVAHPVLGEEIAAFLVADSTVQEGAVRAACLRGLTPDKRPRHIFFRSALPRNPNGKILKRELRDSFTAPETQPN